MHRGVGVHEHELVGIQCGADAIGRVDHHGQPLQVGEGFGIDKWHKRTHPDHGGLTRRGPLLAPAHGLQITGRPHPTVRIVHRRALHQWRMAIGDGIGGVAGGQQPRTHPGQRPVGTVYRAHLGDRHGDPGAGPLHPGPHLHRRHRDRAQDVEHQPSDPQFGAVEVELFDGPGQQRQRGRTVLDGGIPVAGGTRGRLEHLVAVGLGHPPVVTVAHSAGSAGHPGYAGGVPPNSGHIG